MHHSALANCKWFYDSYLTKPNANSLKIAEIGSQDVNGSLRSIFPANHEYKGIDFVAGKGVDVILDDPYKLPFADDSFDVVLSSSCFEHSDMFWLLFIEIMRILKPDGLFYLNIPSNGVFHRWPVDSWRFYPDSGHSLVKWARRSGIPAVLLESYISRQVPAREEDGFWNDFVGVFLKDERFVKDHPQRILDKNLEYMNGYVYGTDTVKNFSTVNEDLMRITVARKILQGTLRVNT